MNKAFGLVIFVAGAGIGSAGYPGMHLQRFPNLGDCGNAAGADCCHLHHPTAADMATARRFLSLIFLRIFPF